MLLGMSVLGAQFGSSYDPIAEGRASIASARTFRSKAAAETDPAMSRVYADQVPMQLKVAATHRRNAQKGTSTSFGNDPMNDMPSRSSRPRSKK